MFKIHEFLLVSCCFASVFTTGAWAVTPFSQYGMVQNVQNYSSNPFYNNGAYVSASPKAVYANGPSIKPSDCQVVVNAIVENVCAQRLNCKNTQLSDVRPDVMVALSKLPGYNYSVSCVGYIDAAYEQYMRQNKATNVMVNTAFPSVPGGARAAVKPTTKATGYQAEYNERANELRALQAQTKTTSDTVTQTDFPKTFNDLSFYEKNEIKRQGYEKYKDAQVYVPLNIVPEKVASVEEEAKSVYDCIKKYGDAENDATTRLYDEYDANGVSGVAYANAATQMKLAVRNAILSACACTNGVRNQDKLRKMMSVNCDNAFVEYAQKEAHRFVNGISDKLANAGSKK